MATVSELVVLVTANTSQFQSGIAKAGTTTSKFGAIAKVGMAVAAVAVVKFVADSVEAYNDHEDALLKLQNTISNSPQLVGASVQAFEDQADTLQALTGVQDEEILRADALLGRFRLTADQIQTLNPLILDYARATGIDAESAADKLGKATLGNAKALKTLGINFKATGNVAKDFNSIQDLLEKKVGGLAEAYGKTLPGQLDIAAAKFDDIKETVGQAVVPILQKLLDLAKPLVNVLKLAADHLDLVVAAGIGFAAVKFLPGLLFQIALGLEAVGASSIASGIGNVAGSLVALGGGVAILATADLAGLAYLINKMATGADPTFAVELGHGLAGIALEVPGLQKKLEGLPPTLERLAKQEENASKRAQQFGLAKDNFAEFSDAVEESVQVTVGEFENLNDAFDTTPKELEKALKLAITIARREQRTLAEIAGDDSISNAQKRALLALPANQRDAWAQAGEAGKRQIEKDAKTLQDLTERKFKEITNAAKGPAKAGGQGIGASMMSGSILGIAQHAPELNTAVAKAVQDAIQAGRDAAKAGSPSKKMMELGSDMILGLIEGLEKNAQKAVDAATKVLQKVLDAASSFRNAIRSGFGGFSDISGAFGSAEAPPTPESISAFAASQAAGAQQFADVLNALKRQGASKGLLGQIAAGGPEAIPFAQALLQGGPALIEQVNESLKTIAGLAGDTAERLTKSFFGEKIDRLRDRVVEARDELRKIREDLRFAENNPKVIININGDVTGQDLVDKIEAELIQRLKRQGAILNGAVRT